MKKLTFKNITAHQNNEPYSKVMLGRLNRWKASGEYHILAGREKSGLFTVVSPDCPFLYNCLHLAGLTMTRKGAEPNILLHCEHIPYDGLPDKLAKVDQNITTPKRFWSPKGQLSLSDLVHHRCYAPPYYWVKAPLTSDDIASISTAIAHIVNTRAHDYTFKINRLLNQNHCPSIFERVILSHYGDTFCWEYVAGQDYTSEINTIRRYLRQL